MAPRRKRAAGSAQGGRPSKQPKLAAELSDDSDEEESMETILAQIREQEESEALARQLAGPSGSTMDAEPSSPTPEAGGSGGQDGPMHVDEDEDYDEDAAMRWAMEESMKAEASAQASRRESMRRLSQPKRKVDSSENGSSQPTVAASTYHSTESDVPPDVQLTPHISLFTEDGVCSACSKTIEAPHDLTVFSAHDIPPTLAISLHIVCKPCKRVHCRGCKAVVSCPVSCKGPSHSKSSSCEAIICCAEVRAIALYEALSAFDSLYNGEQEASKQRTLEAAKKRSADTTHSVGPGGTGYGTGGGVDHYGYGMDEMDGFYGYRGFGGRLKHTRGRGRGRGGRATRANKHDAVAVADGWDQTVARALRVITTLLPEPYAEDPKTYDLLPHASIGPLLALSQVPTLLSDLLRNDSVTDWSARADVYQATLGLLRRLADCELTVGVLIERPFERKDWEGLGAWMDEEDNNRDIDWTCKPASPSKGKGKRKDTGPPQYERGVALYSHFKKLTRQCETFLASADQLMDGSGSEEEELAIKATSLCGDVIAARDDLERAMTVLGRSMQDPEPPAAESEPGGSRSTRSSTAHGGKGKGVDESVEMERQYTRECERLAFAHTTLSDSSDIGGLRFPFYYNGEVRESASSTRTPKNRLHLIKELSTIATSLPPGVFMRVDEVRNDVIKIMIAGPDGTPYEGGLFEFDCFIPLEYPQVAPKLHLRTTGGGTVRFNPNLYNEGKVCLSLLGTWPGRPEEQWQPGKSTLLQVIVSIQSMILIDLPYFNEPGFGQAKPDHPASISYNKNISAQTTRWAIVDWMKPENRTSIWADVIAMHFSIRKTKVRATIEGWSQSIPAIQNYTPSAGRSIYGEEMFYDPNALHRRTAPKKLPPAPKGIDLLEMFDEGITQIESWQDNAVE
ncbi:hypothetical protein PENSPDRAFT_643229 [Peniophora sp. CONT]|nr:hypothetical protein PENSPDRAFT_643229 [Peniophora sp. CONT]